MHNIVTAEPVSPQYLASHEIASANIEQLVFDNIPPVRDFKPGSLDSGDVMAAHLVAEDPDRRIGTAIMLRVMPGDRIAVSADAYYEGAYQGGDNVDGSAVLESLMSTLLGGQNYDGVPMSELPDNVRTIEQALGNPELAGQLSDLLDASDDPGQPRAHLNYLLFDDQMRLSPGESGALQVTGGSVNVWGIVENYNIFVTEPGYIVVYIDNQSIGHDVWFDNVHLEHYTSEVLEEDHYYPFGLTISEDAATGAAPNSIKYNSKELQGEFDLQYYDYGARMYNSKIGRWNGIDPIAEKFAYESPVCYAGNNPVRNIDVEGKYKLSSQTRQQSKLLAQYLDQNVLSDVLGSPTIINGLKKYGQFKDINSIKAVLSKNSGPSIRFVDEIQFNGRGYYTGGSQGSIEIRRDLVDDLNNAKTNEQKKLRF